MSAGSWGSSGDLGGRGGGLWGSCSPSEELGGLWESLRLCWVSGAPCTPSPRSAHPPFPPGCVWGLPLTPPSPPDPPAPQVSRWRVPRRPRSSATTGATAPATCATGRRSRAPTPSTSSATATTSAAAPSWPTSAPRPATPSPRRWGGPPSFDTPPPPSPPRGCRGARRHPPAPPPQVRAHGPGLEKTGVAVNKPAEFTVDAKSGGKGPLKVQMQVGGGWGRGSWGGAWGRSPRPDVIWGVWGCSSGSGVTPVGVWGGGWGGSGGAAPLHPPPWLFSGGFGWCRGGLGDQPFTHHPSWFWGGDLGRFGGAAPVQPGSAWCWGDLGGSGGDWGSSGGAAPLHPPPQLLSGGVSTASGHPVAPGSPKGLRVPLGGWVWFLGGLCLVLRC